MKEQIARRTLLAAGPLALAACSRAEEAYFGNTNPPTTQRLTMVLEGEPESLDPALAMGLIDSLILSLFEGLTTLDPSTSEAMAGLATHYEISGDGLRYTFYLRGHPQPAGTRLPNSRDLPAEYSRGRSAVSDAVPARWSDGRFITAHDFVYSWRRALEPSTGSMLAFLLYPVRYAREISAGKVDPSRLGVRAAGESTLEVELEHLAPYFLELVSSRVMCAVPQHAIASGGRSWTEPGRMVSSGAFRLRERRPFDSIVLDRNPFYYDAGQVALRELAFLIPRDPATVVNLYRSGVVTVGSCTIPTILPILRRKRDFRPHRVYGADFMALNTATPPFDDVHVRYAFNMATDKRPVANLWGGGNVPAAGMVPPSATYQGPQSLMISIEGKDYDVLSYNPQSARELLRRVNKPPSGRIECFTSHSPDSVLWAQVLKDQWRTNLGVEVDIVLADFPTWLQAVKNGTFRQVATSGSSGSFIDPVWFLDLFTSLDGYGTHWSDPRYNAMLEEAKSTPDDALRRSRLLECERRLLTGMPVLPQSYWVDAELVKPFVRGLGANLLDRQQLKYVWIDTHWRPS